MATNNDMSTHSKEIPKLDKVPAFSKLALGKLTPELSIQVLEQAKKQVRETLDLLA